MFDKDREAIFDAMAPEWGKRALSSPSDTLCRMLEDLALAGKVILDVGAGTGALVEAGLRQNPKRWICCDLSTAMLAQIQASWEENPVVEVLQADAHCLPLEDASFDIVICNAVLPHFHNRRQVLKELERILRPNGQLAINHFIGRHRVNQIHQSSAHSLLRGDLLPAAEVVVMELRALRFDINEAVDNEDRYFILATKAC
ncbi:MAG: class I SAM-dependent methyltransferase [Firmicutes bacterium]|nr:class I SAM-dependent methyltransferase [Bacillota bacterium]